MAALIPENKLHEQHTVLFFLLINMQVLLLDWDIHPRTLHHVGVLGRLTLSCRMSRAILLQHRRLKFITFIHHKSKKFRFKSFRFTLAGFTILRRLVRIPKKICVSSEICRSLFVKISQSSIRRSFLPRQASIFFRLR